MSKRIGVPNLAGWQEERLLDLCKLISRGTAPTYVDESTVFAIGQRCIREPGFDANSARPHSQRAKNALRAELGDVLLNSTGTGTIGRSCIFNAVGKFVVDGHVTVLRVDKTRVDPRWIDAMLRSRWGQQHLESHCFTGSTNQLELSRSDLIEASLPLPSLDEQRRIAEILDTVDSAIGQSRQVISKLEMLLAGLTASLLRSITAPMSQVGNLFEVKAGITLGPSRAPANRARDYLRVANVQRGHISLQDVAKLEATRREEITYSLCKGDLLVVEGHANPDEIGRCALVGAHAAGMLYQNHLFRLRSPSVIPEFGELWLNSELSRRYWVRRCATSSGLYTINSKMLASLPFPEITPPDQARVIEPVASLNTQLVHERESLTQLLRVRTGLLEDLLTGQVQV